MAVDHREERVNDILPFVTNAQIGDSTNPEFFESLGIRNFDVCIVAIGNNFQSSLETTSNLTGGEYMRDFLLVIVLLILFGFGFIIMKKLDSFLEENRKAISSENEKEDVSLILLTTELSDSEIIHEIRQFSKKHENTKILICDDIDGINKK